MLAELSESTEQELRAFLPTSESRAKLLDLGASGTSLQYQRAIEAVLADEGVDALILIHVPVGVVPPSAVKKAIGDGVTAARSRGSTAKPVLVCLMTELGTQASSLSLQDDRVPIHLYPETAGRVLGKVATYAEWRRQPPGMIPDFEAIQPSVSREICQQALTERGPGWLSTEETRAVLQAMNLPVARGVAQNADEAVELANQVGFPVAVKVASHEIVHKSEVGAVQLALPNQEAVRQVIEEIQERLAEAGLLDAIPEGEGCQIVDAQIWVGQAPRE